MLNNSELKEGLEFEKFIQKGRKKLKLYVGRSICIQYTFIIPKKRRNDVCATVALLSKSSMFSIGDFEMTETADYIKVEINMLFEGCSLKSDKCFSKIYKEFLYTKSILDVYTCTKRAKSFKMSCSFATKNLQKYNNKILMAKGIEVHNDLLLPGRYSKYTVHINYNLEVYKNMIYFSAYTGNIENAGVAQAYFEIVNKIIELNTDYIK